MKSNVFSFWKIFAGFFLLFMFVLIVTLFVGNRLIGNSQSELAGVGYVAAFLGSGMRTLLFCSPVVAGLPLLFAPSFRAKAFGTAICACCVVVAIFIATSS